VPALSTLPAALLSHSPGPYAALVVAGFAIGALGHLTRIRWLVAAGVALIFLGALLFPFVVHLGGHTPQPPSEPVVPSE
jgi:hypothetical protein